MNLTTITVSGLAISLFAAAIAVRATQRPKVDRGGWLRLPPVTPAHEAEPRTRLIEDEVSRDRLREIEHSYERAVRKDARAKQEATEALTDMRHARSRLAESRESDASDQAVRSYWEQSFRSASLRFASATHESRKALLAIDAVRRALDAQTGGGPSRVSVDSSK